MTSKKQSNKPVAPVATIVQAAPTVLTGPSVAQPIFTTFHVAQKFGMTGVALRRVLRSMPEYADGVHTAYRWVSIDDADPIMTRIAEAIGLRSAQRAAAQQAAQAALAVQQARAQAQAQANAQAKTASPAVAPSKRK
jgi:hypothetical protein